MFCLSDCDVSTASYRDDNSNTDYLKTIQIVIDLLKRFTKTRIQLFVNQCT